MVRSMSSTLNGLFKQAYGCKVVSLLGRNLAYFNRLNRLRQIEHLEAVSDLFDWKN